MSGTVYFFVAVPSTILEMDTDLLCYWNNVKINRKLLDIVQPVVRSSPYECSCVRLWNCGVIPSYIEYRKKPTPFETMIPREFVEQVKGGLQHGTLIRAEIPQKRETTTTTRGGGGGEGRQKGNKYKAFPSVELETALLGLFVQQCQLVSHFNKLLPFVDAWMNDCEPDSDKIQEFKRKSLEQKGEKKPPNIKLRCCFNNLVLFGQRMEKLGMLKHECKFAQEPSGLNSGIVTTASKWFGDNEFSSANEARPKIVYI